MSPVFMVVADVFTHEAFQMALIEDNDVSEKIPAAVTEPALCNAVLPRTLKAGSLRLNARALMVPTTS
jgi:hypothetical protein